jgi:hypothetical protein
MEMKKYHLLKPLLVSLFFIRLGCLYSQTRDAGEKQLFHPYSDSILLLPARPWKAATEIAGLNAGVWAFSRYMLHADYSRIGWKSMKRNFRNGFAWDNDRFSTNLLAHPYHGGLYFNAARSSGMNLQESMLYTIGGSLMWEYLMENERPSINDFISTPIGGVCLGEITFRLSSRLIDDRTAGWMRLGREFLITLINPAQGLNRIMSGDAWKQRNFRGQPVESSPVRLQIAGGTRILAESRDVKLDNGMFIDLKLLHGSIFSEENERPYESFSISSTLNFFSNQPLVSNVCVVSQLWGMNIPLKNRRIDLHWGVFQHFDYYDSETMLEKSQTASYRISEAAAFGAGGQFGISLTEKTAFAVDAHLNAILLGGSITDYYRVGDRDYNIGSGFSSKINWGLIFGTKAVLSTCAEYYQLFTWKGYDPEIDLTRLTPKEQSDLNVRGDEGNTCFTVLKANFSYRFHRHCSFSAETSCYLRTSRHRFFPDVKSRIMESKLGVGYLF